MLITKQKILCCELEMLFKGWNQFDTMDFSFTYECKNCGRAIEILFSNEDDSEKVKETQEN